MKIKEGASKEKRTVKKYRCPIAVSGEDAERFQQTIREWDGLALAAAKDGQPIIGMLGEKSLHSILKRFITDDPTCYEVRILSKDGGKAHRYVADICIGDRIYEIQTGGFYPLIPKISYYLNETDYDVTIVHPIPAVRYKVWIDPETGSVESRKKSPRRGYAEDALRELFWLRDMIMHPRFHVRLLFLEEEEYRYLDGWSYDKKKGSNRCERVPAALLGTLDLRSAEDYRPFLSPELPDEFTASEFGKLYGFRGKAVYSALKVFLAIGLFEKIGTRGRSALYCRTDAKQETETACATLSEIEQEDLCE